MSFLHQNDIIHRDLKPANILIDDSLYPKISDFGMSKTISNSRSSLQSTACNIKGTLKYMGPEVFESGKYDKTGDVYSFSIILYELCTNEEAFKEISNGEAILEFFTKVALENMRPKFDVPIPESYQNLIERCWAKDPSDRPTFDEIVTELKTDEGFITDAVDKDEFESYVSYIEDSNASFYKDNKVVKVEKGSDGKTLQLVSIEDEKPADNTDQELIKIVEEPNMEYFVLGRNNFEGINGCKQDSALGIKYLKKGCEAGCLESTVYLCRLLIDGTKVPRNIANAKKYLSAFSQSDDPRVITLLGRIEEEEGNILEAGSLFKKASDLGSTESMFEYGKMCYYESLKYLKIAAENKHEESSQFLATHFKNPNEKPQSKEKRRRKKVELSEEGHEQDPKKDGKIIKLFSNIKDKIKTIIKKDAPVEEEETNDEKDKNDNCEESEEYDYDYDDVDDEFSYLDVIEERLKLNPPVSGRRQAVLLCTGSFNPIHKGHFHLLDTAAKFLSKQHNIDSIIGILSPSCDEWVAPRFGEAAISFKDRLETLKLACKEHNSQKKSLFIVPSSWEGNQNHFIDFPDVKHHFKKEIARRFKDKNLLVLYVCGGELFMETKCFKRNGYVGIARPGFKIDARDKLSQDVFVCNDKKYTGHYTDASLALKLARKYGQPFKGLTYDSVADYLHNEVHWA